VRISVKRPSQPAKATVFTFRRDKLFTWRLVHIRLPWTSAEPALNPS
jgi:hypothetical protein